MNQTSAETLSVVVERDMPHPPEKIWRALTQPHRSTRSSRNSGNRPSKGVYIHTALPLYRGSIPPSLFLRLRTKLREGLSRNVTPPFVDPPSDESGEARMFRELAPVTRTRQHKTARPLYLLG
jgi:hypothetical protein